MKLHECTMKIQEWKTETTSLMDFFIIQTFTMMIMTKKRCRRRRCQRQYKIW